MDLDPSTLPAYLRALGVAPPDADVAVTVLAGGVSNVVLCARWPGGAVVVKQSLARLRVAAEWEFDRARIFVERRCLEVLDDLLPGAAPRVVFHDDPEFVLGMELAPDGGTVWREDLAGGRIDPETVTRASTLLARIQDRTAAAPGLAEQFDDRMPLIQGRLDPFHRHVAARHPDLAARIEAEVERTLGARGVLVHGDYSPKNLIAYPDRVLLLDCEVAHWGDPAFDPAFLLCHLLLDGAHLTASARAQADAAALAWRTYVAQGGRAGDDAVVAELGCLLLARVDGKSPLPNLGAQQAGAVRAYARHLLLLPSGAPVATALADSVAFLAPADQDTRS